MNSNDKPQFSRTPGGMSVRAIIKAKPKAQPFDDVANRSDEYFARSHALGMLRSVVKICLRVDPDRTKEILGELVFDGAK